MDRRYLAGRPDWQPGDVSGLTLWLRADRGVWVAGAADFTAASTQYLSVTDTAALSMADIDFSLAAWVRPKTDAGSFVLAAKGNLASYTTAEYSLELQNGFPVFVVGNGTTSAQVIGLSALPANSWAHVAAWHDATANTLNLQVNNGPARSTSYSGGSQNTTGDFHIGKYPNFASGYGNHRQGPTGVWKKALSASEITQLYAAGQGLLYADLDAGLKTNLSAWWNLWEPPGTRSDLHGTNHLTDNNSVALRAGIPGSVAGDTESVSLWEDYSGGNRGLTQATAAARPVLRTGIVQGKPVVRFDGVDDLLLGTALSNYITNSARTMFAVFQASSISTNSANTYANDAVVGDAGGFAGLHLKSGGPTAHAYNWDGTDDQVSVSIALSTPVLVMLRHEGGNLYVSKNGGAESSVASGNLTTLTGALIAGRAGAGTEFAGDIGEIALYNRALTAAEIARVTGYLRSRWGV